MSLDIEPHRLRDPAAMSSVDIQNSFMTALMPVLVLIYQSTLLLWLLMPSVPPNPASIVYRFAGTHHSHPVAPIAFAWPNDTLAQCSMSIAPSLQDSTASLNCSALRINS